MQVNSRKQLPVRLPLDLMSWIKGKAKEEDRSANYVIEQIIAKAREQESSVKV